MEFYMVFFKDSIVLFKSQKINNGNNSKTLECSKMLQKRHLAVYF